MEKNSAKISLGTAVCLFIIILLIAALVGMYLYYNKNDVNPIIKADSNSEKVAIEENEVYKFSDFDLIYKSLVNTEYNNIKSFITSDNKIKNIDVSEITIYTEDYLNATGSKLTEKPDETAIMGSCVFTIEFEDINGLVLAGSKGEIHAIQGNCLTDEKDFIFNKNTKKIELCTALYIEIDNENSNVIENEDEKVDIVQSKSYGEPLPLEGVAKLKEGYLYYSYNNSDEPEKIEGVSNIKSLDIFNIGTGINKVPFVVTNDGVVYRLNSAKQLVVYEELENYKVDKIVSHEGEMYDIFTLLLLDGTTKVVEVRE